MYDYICELHTPYNVFLMSCTNLIDHHVFRGLDRANFHLLTEANLLVGYNTHRYVIIIHSRLALCTLYLLTFLVATEHTNVSFTDCSMTVELIH